MINDMKIAIDVGAEYAKMLGKVISGSANLLVELKDDAIRARIREIKFLSNIIETDLIRLSVKIQKNVTSDYQCRENHFGKLIYDLRTAKLELDLCLTYTSIASLNVALHKLTEIKNDMTQVNNWIETNRTLP